MLCLGGLYTPRISGWSGSNRRSAFSLAQNLGDCECCGHKKVRGCSTGVLLTDRLIPGQFPVRGELSLAVDLGRVTEPAPGNAEFSLAVDLGLVAEPVPWNAEFLLAVWDPIPDDPGCLSFRLRGRSFLGSLREASCGGVFSEGEGEARSSGH